MATLNDMVYEIRDIADDLSRLRSTDFEDVMYEVDSIQSRAASLADDLTDHELDYDSLIDTKNEVIDKCEYWEDKTHEYEHVIADLTAKLDKAETECGAARFIAGKRLEAIADLMVERDELRDAYIDLWSATTRDVDIEVRNVWHVVSA